MSLYHEYRPVQLSEIRGNATIVKSLTKFFKNIEKMPRVFLFSGPTGCGKTTFSRIIKNVTNTDDRDYQEINFADQRGIDTSRNIIHDVGYGPLFSPYKIINIDECQKMTSDAQNALLRVLEEPPKWVIFILTTTDRSKLIKPIIGRCQEYKVKPLSDSEMLEELLLICKSENFKIKQNVLIEICKSSGNHPRMAIQILENLANLPEKEQLEIAKDYNDPESSQAINLCRTLSINNFSWKAVSQILSDLKKNNADPEAIRRLVLNYFQAILLKGSFNLKAALILEVFSEPFYDTGFPQLTLACSEIFQNKI